MVKRRAPLHRTTRKMKVVKLAPTEVLRVKLPGSVAPVLAVDARKNVVEIAPVPKPKKQSWMDYLFGTEKN